jgi:hypothetical protein
VRALVIIVVSLMPSAGCGLLLDPDGRPGDVDAAVDGAAVDAWADAPIDVVCATPDPSTIALYDFDEDSPTDPTILDGSGLHPGTRVGAQLTPDGLCGAGLTFPPASPVSFGRLPNSFSSELAEGSVELWIKPASPGIAGILSRDESGTDTPGHLSLYRADDGHLALRLQGGIDGPHTWRCSNEPIPENSWTHVGINWGGTGGLELWVDGRLATLEAVPSGFFVLTSRTGMLEVPCSATSNPTALDGNDLTWVLGASTTDAASPDDVGAFIAPFADGVVDEIHFRRVRVDFSRP